MAFLLRIATIALISTLIISFASAQQCSYKKIKPKKSSPVTAANWEYSVIAKKTKTTSKHIV